MCEKCAELGEKIELYRQALTQGFDLPTTQLVENLVADLERQKNALRH